MNPFISIIIPVYQAESTIKRCVDSVLSQTYSGYEIILIDDGSKDGSGSICDYYTSLDERIKVYHQENAGVSSARNKGISIAKGEYLLFLDSDDALLPNALINYAEITGKYNVDVVIAGLSVIENGKETRKIVSDKEIYTDSKIWEDISNDSTIFGYAGGKLVKRGIIIDNDIKFDANMQSQEDLDFFLSVYGKSNSFFVMQKCVYTYFYAVSKRTPPFWDFIKNQIKILNVGSMRTELTEKAKESVKARIVSLLYTGLYGAVENRNFDEVIIKLSKIEKLKDILKETSLKGEHKFIVKNYIKDKYNLIKRYFVLRNKIRDIVRRIKG